MITITYTLTGTGWAECVISDENKSVAISASYLSDALGGLLSAAMKLISSENIVNTSFDEEPGEYRWVFEKTKEGMVQLTILEFNELWGNEPDSAGKSIFQIECTLRDLVTAIYKAADKVLQDYGEEGYKEKWYEHSFPLEQYNSIKNWLTAK